MLSACTGNPLAQCRKRAPLYKLLIGYGTSVVALRCASLPVGSEPVVVPGDNPRTISPPTDTLRASYPKNLVDAHVFHRSRDHGENSGGFEILASWNSSTSCLERNSGASI